MVNAMKKKSSAILYHYYCPDGAFAALAAHLYFKATSSPALFFPNRVYRPLRADDLPLHDIGDLYLLDFVGPSGFVQEISSKVERVVILDHHKTAFEKLGDESSLGENVIKVIDMGRSGATIAFDYFKEKLMNPDTQADVDVKYRSVLNEFERVRQLFQYVEDGDLWRWKLQNSKAFSSGLRNLKIDFDAQKNPSLFELLLSLDLDSVINQGMVSLSREQKLIDDCLSHSYEIAIGGGAFGRCLAVNADTDLSDLRSELGHQLATKSQNFNLRGIGAVVYKVAELEDDRKLKVSLRSLDNEDTTPISQKFGGGGHCNASSFMINSEEFEQWKLLSLDLDSVINQGMVSLSHQQKLIDDCLSHSYEIAIGGGAFGRCLAVNADTDLSDLRSELGHQLATKSQNFNLRGIGAVVYKVAELEDDRKLKVSLRSLDNEDTTPISQKFGGGGHRNASSFMINSEEFEQWKV